MEPFHSAPPLHTHRQCKNCYKFRRCVGGNLFKCTACYVDNYCSKECQKAKWPSHKMECKRRSALRADLTLKTGNPQAWIDFMNWIEYHHSNIINSMVAALDLPNYPSEDQHAVLALDIHYSDDRVGAPPERRFRIRRAGLIDIRRSDPVGTIFKELLLPSRAPHVAMGKVEFGNLYAGTGMFNITADFGSICIPWPKYFGIDKETARDKVNVDPGWKTLLFKSIDEGKKQKFCCGKLEEGVCCCGGWSHTDMQERIDRARSGSSTDNK